MSIKIMSLVWEVSPTKGNELLMMLALADNANDQGWCWPSHDTLGDKNRVVPQSARRTLDALEEMGEIDIYNRLDEKHPDQHMSNVYHLRPYAQGEAEPPELRGLLKMRLSSGRASQPRRGVGSPTTVGVGSPTTVGVGSPTTTESLKKNHQQNRQLRAAASPSKKKDEYDGIQIHWDKIENPASGAICYEDGTFVTVQDRPKLVQDALALYGEFHAAMVEIGRFSEKSYVADWEKHEPAAFDLALKRVQADEIIEYVIFRYRQDDGFWPSRTYSMSLKHINEKMRDWQLSREATKAIRGGKGASADYSPPAEPEYRERYVYTQAEIDAMNAKVDAEMQSEINEI